MRHTDFIKVTVEGFAAKPEVFLLSPSAGRKVKKELLADRLAKRVMKEPTIHAREVLPLLDDDVQRPAIMLRASRYKKDMTQKQLSEKLKIRQHHVSEMENAKRPIGRAMAKRLATIFKCDYRVFV